MHDAQSCMMHVWRDEMCAAATQDVWLWQDKTSVVARNKGTTKGGGRRRRPPPLCGGGRRPPPLFLATTEVLSCHNEHPVLPQRTSRLATQEIRRIASQRRMDVPMFFGHNSTLAAPFGASMGGIDIIFQRASFWIGPMYLV